MQPDATVVRHILAEAGIDAASVEETTLGVECRLEAADVLAALAALKASELDFVMLVDLLGTDTSEGVEVTYHLRSFTRDEEIFVKIGVAYDATVASVWNIYPSALMPERETAELLGLSLSGHPNPKRLLTTDGVAPLLRKEIAIRSLEEVRDR